MFLLCILSSLTSSTIRILPTDSERKYTSSAQDFLVYKSLFQTLTNSIHGGAVHIISGGSGLKIAYSQFRDCFVTGETTFGGACYISVEKIDILGSCGDSCYSQKYFSQFGYFDAAKTNISLLTLFRCAPSLMLLENRHAIWICRTSTVRNINNSNSITVRNDAGLHISAGNQASIMFADFYRCTSSESIVRFHISSSITFNLFNIINCTSQGGAGLYLLNATNALLKNGVFQNLKVAGYISQQNGLSILFENIVFDAQPGTSLGTIPTNGISIDTVSSLQFETFPCLQTGPSESFSSPPELRITSPLLFFLTALNV